VNYDVIILGAGAAGLLCAITAANRGRKVLVLEKSNKVGKKILMSGGGRCNFTNYYVTAENFISGNEHFAKAALNRYTQWDFIALVEKHGVAYEERTHGQLFCQHSAKDIVALLLDECANSGVMIRTQSVLVGLTAKQADVDLKEPTEESSTFSLKVELAKEPLTLECQSLVIATGALSIPTLGGSGVGYEIAQQFKLPTTERRAGLVPFMFTDAMKSLCEKLSGLSLPVEMTCNGQSFSEQLLFTHRGISGPVVLQISSYWYPGDAIGIDLLPDVDAGEWLLAAKQDQPRRLLRSVLMTNLPNAFVLELQNLWWSSQAETLLAEFSDKQLIDIGRQLNSWSLKPSATEGYRTAEVTLGGVDTDAISSKTMMAKNQQGLYFVGEVLDISGHLGGFNFQWAWSSGYSAGLDV
jgi:predicted Rossmann fold flavoprotein